MSLNLRSARSVLRDAATAVAECVSEIADHGAAIGRLRVRIGVQYVAVQQALAAQPTAFDGTWKDWAEKNYQGGPDVYRLANAGAVAIVLGDAVAEATERHLAPLYRILKAAEKGSDEDRAKAEEKVRSVWKSLNARRKATDPMPSEEKVLEAVDKATGTTGGTRGKKAGSTGTSSAKAKGRSTRKSRGKKVEEKVEDLQPVGPSIGEAELRSLSTKVRNAVSRIETEDLQSYLHTVLAVCKWSAMYGTDAVEGAVRAEVRDARNTRRKAA